LLIDFKQRMLAVLFSQSGWLGKLNFACRFEEMD